MMRKIAACAFGLLLAGFGAAFGAEQCPPNNFPTDKSLVLATRGGLKSLDPYALDEAFTLSMLGNVYEGLVRRDQNGSLIGALAERWETNDYKTWRFYLRKDVKFRQGEEFTADDVLFSAKRVRARGSDLVSRLPADAKVIKVDDYTVDFILTEANPLLPLEWDTWYILPRPWIISRQAEDSESIDTAHGLAASSTNGTGPFSISRHEANSSVFVPNPQWWGATRPTFGAIAVCSNSDDIDRVDVLLDGTAQLVEPVLPADIQRVNAAPGVTVLAPSAELLTVFLGFDLISDQLRNSDAEGNPFKDPRVRTAIYHAIDADSIKAGIMRNTAVLAASIVTPAISPPVASLTRRRHDVDAARNLLVQAGYPDGFTVQMDCPIGLYINDEEICRAVKDMLLPVGIDVTLKNRQKDAFLATLRAHNSSFFIFGWAPESFDIWNVLNNLAACPKPSKFAGRFNFGGFCDARVDATIAKIRDETAVATRDTLVTDVLKKIYDDSVYIPLHQQMLIWGGSKNITFVQRKNNRIFFNEFTRR